jgi:hypothetical protein
MKLSDNKYSDNGEFVFFSYSQKDKDVVNLIISDLLAAGYRVWWDEHLLSGTVYEKEILAKLSKATALVIYITKHSSESRSVLEEVKKYLELNKIDEHNELIIKPIVKENYLKDYTKKLPALYDKIGIFQAIIYKPRNSFIKRLDLPNVTKGTQVRFNYLEKTLLLLKTKKVVALITAAAVLLSVLLYIGYEQTVQRAEKIVIERSLVAFKPQGAVSVQLRDGTKVVGALNAFTGHQLFVRTNDSQEPVLWKLTEIEKIDFEEGSNIIATARFNNGMSVVAYIPDYRLLCLTANGVCSFNIKDCQSITINLYNTVKLSNSTKFAYFETADSIYETPIEILTYNNRMTGVYDDSGTPLPLQKIKYIRFRTEKDDYADGGKGSIYTTVYTNDKKQYDASLFYDGHNAILTAYTTSGVKSWRLDRKQVKAIHFGSFNPKLAKSALNQSF